MLSLHIFLANNKTQWNCLERYRKNCAHFELSLMWIRTWSVAGKRLKSWNINMCDQGIDCWIEMHVRHFSDLNTTTKPRHTSHNLPASYINCPTNLPFNKEIFFFVPNITNNIKMYHLFLETKYCLRNINWIQYQLSIKYTIGKLV